MEARAHLITAIAMYREMDMPYWRDQGELEVSRL